MSHAGRTRARLAAGATLAGAVLLATLALSGCPHRGGGGGATVEVAEPVPAEIEWPDAAVPRAPDAGVE